MNQPGRLRQRGILGGVMLAICSISATASAAEPSSGDRETARGLGTQGLLALDAHDYATAERACGGAYALVKAPTVGTCWARALVPRIH